jgi:hypothetical protein
VSLLVALLFNQWGKTMNEKVPLIGRDWMQNSFKTLVYRHLRKQRRDERRLAEQRTTKHQFEASKSCVADARSYRVAREFPRSVAAQLDWKTLIPRPPT